LRRGSVQPAIESVRQALAIDPGLAEAYFVLGRAYGTIGQMDSAAAAIRRGLEFDPQNAAGRSLLQATQPP
jgi:Tfp pilus assembly protein PilF